MNTAPPSSSNTSKNYVSIEDMECATLLPRKDDSMIGKKNQSNVSLKNVAYGLGIVALACSGSFVAGRSAAQYKLSGGTSQLGVAPARLGSKASSVKPTPPNTVTQTVHHERAFKSILRERERQRERESAASPHSTVVLEEQNSTFFSRKKVTKKDAERRAFSSLFSTRFERFITHTKHTHTHS